MSGLIMDSDHSRVACNVCTDVSSVHEGADDSLDQKESLVVRCPDRHQAHVRRHTHDAHPVLGGTHTAGTPGGCRDRV